MARPRLESDDPKLERRRALQRECRRRYVEKHPNAAKEYAERNKEKIAEYARGRYDRIRRGKPDLIRADNLRKYGLTQEKFEQMRINQGDKCSICEKPFGQKVPHIDHVHGSRLVRGLLCQTCNTTLGKFKDDPGLLRKAADYIEKHRAKVVKDA